jgi:alpha-galactosidase
MNTFTKTVTAKTNAYKITFDDGTNLTRNAKKDFNFAVIFKAESGICANKWQVWGLASDSKKAARAVAACESNFKSRRVGRHVIPAIPSTVMLLKLC